MFGEPVDIAFAFAPDGAGVADALAVARDRGLLTVALLGGHGGAAAAVPGLDHVIPHSTIARMQRS